MNLLLNSSKSITRISQVASLTRRPEYRLFSTEAPAAQQPTPAVAFDPFSGSLPRGEIIARLNGITKYTSKTDILNLIGNPSLSFEDIKYDYSISYTSQLSALVRLPSRQAYEAGSRSLARKCRYRLDQEFDPSKWDSIKPFDGKYVLLQGIPRTALREDISSFLSGCPHDASSIEIFNQQGRMSIVGFPSRELAVNAVLTKNRELCLSQQIKMQVLY